MVYLVAMVAETKWIRWGRENGGDHELTDRNHSLHLGTDSGVILRECFFISVVPPVSKSRASWSGRGLYLPSNLLCLVLLFSGGEQFLGQCRFRREDVNAWRCIWSSLPATLACILLLQHMPLMFAYFSGMEQAWMCLLAKYPNSKVASKEWNEVFYQRVCPKLHCW